MNDNILETPISTEVLYVYFAGEATARQKQQIDVWATDQQDLELFYECLASWEAQNITIRADETKAIKRHQQRMARRHNLPNQ